MFRIQPHASPQERIKSTQDHGLAPQSWRAIASEAQVAAHLSQHTNGQRAQAAQSMRHWPADPPPRAKHASSVTLPVPVERRASQLIQLEICVPLQPRTEQTFKQTPRDLYLITAANVKRRAGAGRQVGEWFKPASKWTLEVHQLTASCLP